jgi:hypothetical protein
MQTFRILLLIPLALALGACENGPPTSTVKGALPRNTAPPNPPSAVSGGDLSNSPNLVVPSPVSTATIFPTPTPPKVTVAAVKGNVFIRRGPDFAYNAVSVLMDGQSAEALARDVLANWVQIPIPDRPHETGWISIQTRFVEVSGDSAKLPELTPTDWPVLASVRNCTYHYMEANPGGIVIPAVYNFPENDVQINPGVYIIRDLEVEGNPEVMEVEVKEGLQIEILYDGGGEHKKCPQQ